MSDARKHWTKSQLIPKLEQVNRDILDLKDFAEEAGQMPTKFRRRIISCMEKNRVLISDIRDWAITSDEELLRKSKEMRR